MRYIAIILAALALIAASAGAPSAAQRFDVQVLDSPFIGPVDAPVTIIEFIDYQ